MGIVLQLAFSLTLAGLCSAVAGADCQPQRAAPAVGTHLIYTIDLGAGQVIDPAFAQTVLRVDGAETTLLHWMELDDDGHPLYEEPALTITSIGGFIPLAEASATGVRRFAFTGDPVAEMLSLHPGESVTLPVTQTVPSSTGQRTQSLEHDFELTFVSCDTRIGAAAGDGYAVFETHYTRLDRNGVEHDVRYRVWIDPEQMWMVRMQSEGSDGFTQLGRIEVP